MKFYFMALSLLLGSLFAQEHQSINQTKTPQTLIDKIKEKELELQVPRDTVPVEEVHYPIQTAIPKSAHFLPMLQTLLDIKVGTLPNPIGISIIGSFMEEHYNVSAFRGRIGNKIGQTIVGGLQPVIADPNNKEQIIAAIDRSFPGLPNLALRTLLKSLVNKVSTGDVPTLNFLSSAINQTLGAGVQSTWDLSEGRVHTQTSAVGLKLDTWIFPFMQLFVAGTYLHMQQSTQVGNATIPLKTPIKIGQNTLSSITFPVGNIENKLDGWAFMGGTNLAIGYKGFFLSCMIAGGYVRLDDLANDIKGFVKKPFMYISPRVGYSMGGVMTAHFGVQRVELFGSTEGNDLSKATGGLVDNFSVEIKKYPVNFLIGTSFSPLRDLGISFEYVFSPDTRGLNAELAYRF